MKKIILITISALLLLVGNLSAQNKTDNKGRKQGAWSKTYPGGSVMYKGTFKDDNPVGIFKHYYESGNLKIEQNHLSGGIVEVKMYEENGETLSATGKYKDKKKEGEWKYYAEKKPTLTEHYKNGKKEGLSKVYSKSGAVIEEIPYKNDKIDGIHRYYLEDGKIYSEVSFKDGLENGDYKLFEGNEKPVVEGKYVDGKKDGEWNLFDENGKVVEVLKYEKGVLLNSRELKEEYTKSFDEREKNQGKFQEPAEFVGEPSSY